MKLENDLKTIEVSLPLFDIMISNLKKNISTRNPQIPEDKTTIVFNKLNDISTLLKNTQKELKKQIDLIEDDVYRSKMPAVDEVAMKRFFRRSALGTIRSDLDVIEKIVSKNTELVILFSSITKYFDQPVYSRYENRLHNIYLDFIQIANEFKTLVKWYKRLLELGY
jgi:hypothetical protein